VDRVLEAQILPSLAEVVFALPKRTSISLSQLPSLVTVLPRCCVVPTLLIYFILLYMYVQSHASVATFYTPIHASSAFSHPNFIMPPTIMIAHHHPNHHPLCRPTVVATSLTRHFALPSPDVSPRQCAPIMWSVVASRVVYPRACDLSCNPYYILVTPIT